MRLGRRRAVGGEPREGRVVNGTVAQVVPRGSIRALMNTHKRDLRVVSDASEAEAAHRNAPVAADLPSMPDSWSVERGRRQLTDLLARARRDG